MHPDPDLLRPWALKHFNKTGVRWHRSGWAHGGEGDVAFHHCLGECLHILRGDRVDAAAISSCAAGGKRWRKRRGVLGGDEELRLDGGLGSEDVCLGERGVEGLDHVLRQSARSRRHAAAVEPNKPAVGVAHGKGGHAWASCYAHCLAVDECCEVVLGADGCAREGHRHVRQWAVCLERGSAANHGRGSHGGVAVSGGREEGARGLNECGVAETSTHQRHVAWDVKSLDVAPQPCAVSLGVIRVAQGGALAVSRLVDFLHE
mmetsp:Transcript_45467/g.91747  ORF Transcript_45467/g.91747 Transcript_45467/m.91747 type:complete len:261 (+) Transcript_45467:138-920(+)